MKKWYKTREVSIDRIRTVLYRTSHYPSEADCHSLLFVFFSVTDKVEYYFSEMHDMASRQKHMDGTQDERKTQSELKKQTATTKNSQKLGLYMNDLWGVLKAQVEQSGCQDILKKQNDSALMTCPMNSMIGSEACRAVEYVFKVNLCPNVIQVSEIENQVQYVVDCLQIYSDRSQTSLSASSYTFHPVLITVLSFTERVGGKQVVLGFIVVAYLPVVYTHLAAVPFRKEKWYRLSTFCVSAMTMWLRP